VFLYADDAKIYKQIYNSSDKENLQNDLNKLSSWADNWLLKLNINKCKKVSFGRHIDSSGHYNINSIDLENIDSIKDLGVMFDSQLNFKSHINDKINKAYSILGIIHRNFTYLDFLVIYKSMVRSHLEYANCLWSPHTKQDIAKYFLSNRTVSIWNSLPDYVVDSNSILFENRLDHFWCNQACYYDYTADIAGTGSRSLQSIEFNDAKTEAVA